MLHTVKAKENPAGSKSMLAVFKQLFNGFNLTQIRDLWTLSKTSAICWHV